jgi:hypothetical protein
MQSRELAVLAAECAAADGAFHCSGGVPLQPARAGWRRLRCVAGSGVGLADGCVAGIRQKGGWVVSMCGSKGWCQQGARRAAGRRESQCRGRPGWWRPCRGGRHTEQQRAPVSRAAVPPRWRPAARGRGPRRLAAAGHGRRLRRAAGHARRLACQQLLKKRPPQPEDAGLTRWCRRRWTGSSR